MKLPFVVPPDSKQVWRSLVKEVNRNKDDEKSIMFINSFRLDDIFNAFSSGSITERDINALRFLMNHKFGTVTQISKVCYQGKSLTNTKKRLQRFLRHQILDCFSWETNGNINDMAIYCLGPGGYHLLRSFDVNSGRWSRRNNIRPIDEVSSFLIINEITSKLIIGPQDYVTEPFIKFNKTRIVPTGSLTYNGHTFLFVSIRSENMLNTFKTNLSGYDSFIEGGAWANIYSLQPILLIIVESDEKALELSEYIRLHSTLKRYRLTTDDRIMFRPLHKAMFSVENGKIIEKIAKIFVADEPQEENHG